MLERLATKTWRFLKGNIFPKAEGKNPSGGFSFKNTIGLIINVFAWREKVVFFPNDPWRFKLRFLLNWHEPESVKACKEIIKPGMNVLDIGAHLGYYSRLFSKLVGPSGTVYAFEPDPPTYKLLVSNISLPKFKNITVIDKAVSDASGKLDFFEMAASGKHSFYDVSQSLANIDPESYLFKDRLSVEAITVDSFLERAGNTKIDFIKMDIEGAEPRALRGMQKTISRSHGLTLLVELNDGSLRAGGSSAGEFLKQLQEFGFEVKKILDAEGKIKSVGQLQAVQAEDGYVNLLCKKENILKPTAS